MNTQCAFYWRPRCLVLALVSNITSLATIYSNIATAKQCNTKPCHYFLVFMVQKHNASHIYIALNQIPCTEN